MNYNAMKSTDMLETVLNRTRGRYLSEEDAKLVEILMAYRRKQDNTPLQPMTLKLSKDRGLTDKELIIFLMDEIDTATDLLVDGQTHMATGVLGGCHAEIRKHLSK